MSEDRAKGVMAISKIDVCITVDIEFSINAALHYPDKYRPHGAHSVTRMANDQSHGLGFILNTLEEYSLFGTFFTEVLNVNYFGYSEMEPIFAQMQKKGQDIQLHLHPCWNYFKDKNWMETIKKIVPNDLLSGRSTAELNEILEEGIDIYKRFIGHVPQAFRVGGFATDKNVYRAMKQNGLFLSSNIGLAYFQPIEKDLHFYSGIIHIEGIAEAPVLSYRLYKLGNKTVNKLLTITGSSWSETKNLLLQAWKQQINPIIILTHAHEFSYELSTQSTVYYKPNKINQSRFRKLCQFLTDNMDKFQVITFHQRAEQWKQQTAISTDILTAPFRSIFFRMLENKLLPLVQQNHINF